MRFLHLSDLHIGKVVNGFSMLEDQRYILDRILSLADEREADAILISGDVYDKPVPTEDAVALFDSFLTRAARPDRAVLVISGNHDSDERLDFARRLLSKSNVHIAGCYRGAVEKVTLSDAYGPVNFYLLPFVKASLVAHYLKEKADGTWDYGEAVAAAIASAGVDTSERNVILSHQFVTAGGSDPDLSGSETVRAESVGAVERVPHGVYDAFDYAALGHIHSPQRVGRDTVRYAGSPLSYSLNEIGKGEKSVPVVTMGEKGDVSTELVPLKPLRRMRRLKGPFAELTRPENVTAPDDYVYATLTDPTPVYDAMRRLQTVYPRAMRLDYENGPGSGDSSDDPGGEAAEQTFDEIIDGFYGRIYGGRPTDEERELLKEIAEEAGVTM